ncbi:MAG: hypothetical protein AAB409_02405 [Gemmatimonadota bacterium]
MRILTRTGPLLALLVLLTGGHTLSAQENSTIVLPPGYDSTRSYPAVVLLPFTGGGAPRLLSAYAAQAGLRSRARDSAEQQLAALLGYMYPQGAGREAFAVMLSGGWGREEDYATADAWSATIVRYEDEILADLSVFAARHSLDTTRIVLAGYSMGGDLAWALSLRNPRRFRGAIVMGSRASYRTAASRMTVLAAREARYFFTVGDHEEPVRLEGARAAAGLLERHGVAHRLRVIPETGHDPAPLEEFEQALRFVLWNSPPPSAVVDLGTGAGGAGRWRAVSAGASHTCALATDSAAYCWGHNGFEGRLGDGTIRSRSYPAPVAGGAAFRSLQSTADHTCGLARDGALSCWGDNSGAKLGDGSDSSRAQPVRSAGGYRFAAVDAGGGHTCGVTTDGRLYCWGSGSSGQLGAATRSRSRVPFPVTGTRRYRAVAAGYSYVCGLEVDGTAYCWGAGNLGPGTRQSRVPVPVPGPHRFESITAGPGHACGLTADGVAYCWGDDGGGYFGAGPVASSFEPVPVGGGLRFLGLDAGASHTCGVTTDHAAYCWGRNERGQLGNGSTSNSNVPTPVAGGLRFASVSAGTSFTCGATTAGAAWCWGWNHAGQLGDGSRRDSTVPVAVLNPRETPPSRE